MGNDLASGRRKNIASQYARTDIRKESFAMRVVETWNRLPERVKLIEKPEPFKKELKKILWLRLEKNGWRNVRKLER
jgi:hypothetical protein